jgi:hypothetical protein
MPNPIPNQTRSRFSEQKLLDQKTYFTWHTPFAMAISEFSCRLPAMKQGGSAADPD